jgi:hypothetical protein
VVSAATLLTGNAGSGLAEGGGNGGRDESDGPSLESDDFLDRPLVESREDLRMTDDFTRAAEGKLTTARPSDHGTPVDFLAGNFRDGAVAITKILARAADFRGGNLPVDLDPLHPAAPPSANVSQENCRIQHGRCSQ